VKPSKTAYGYLRVSSRGQVDGYGYDRQEEAIRHYAKRNGVEIVDFYRDAHTGTEADRPAFLEMLAAILGNGVRTVIVESLDRLARDLMVQTRLIAELQSRGVTLISASTGQDVTADRLADPMREAMVQVQGVFAQLDKKLLVRKLAKAREAMRQETGRCEGRKPYGEKRGEDEVLAKIFAMRRGARNKDRMSFAGISSRLNSEGVPTRTGKPWAPATVYGIVKSQRPRLTGSIG
jgi:site-specific DNA recombinase